ncbi:MULTISPECIES: Rv2231c family pyridoxal phosphate-dependent protein CobC [Prauserella salsuginis group]|uniref:Aminotransferase n=1 Tax=Prauserella salsuginis TaxID=387889 RepID=A0ABW6G945_9PSEU|nr:MULTISPECIES: Rv2231c family pyridoxal phosphate-dependent protein CobC [Prauserella salsuginis group]MCR3719457.1 histidinol-phosphate aminotransferase [Prauserella flava]MCR3735529.1 histidinol-phosphate aminotransferase [Prauserella salsuginis]
MSSGERTESENDARDIDLWHHGDREVGDGLVDLAVNVRVPQPPEWLLAELRDSLSAVAAYPDVAGATEAIAARHGRRPEDVLPTAGGAEAFTLLARAWPVRRPVVVHPQFTEPEAALLAAGHDVTRVELPESGGFALDGDPVPADADLVFVGNPTNPTSVLHPASSIRALARPGRLVVVDEAFLDAVPGEPESLAAARIPGIVVVRSLTKTWGIAGLRAGYVLAEPAVVERLRGLQPPWSVSTPAAVAMAACSRPGAVAEAEALAREAEADRDRLVARLRDLGVHVAGTPRAPFVLVRVPDGEKIRLALREAGYAVRRADTFPGLGPDWLRIAVRSDMNGFLDALAALL